MTKQKTLRLPSDVEEALSLVARAQGKSENQIIIDALRIEINRVRKDTKFMAQLKEHVKRDKEILDRLAK
jgi:predicted DNA-binding protein